MVADYDAETEEGHLTFTPKWSDSPLPYELQLMHPLGDVIGRFEIEDGGVFEKTFDEIIPWNAEVPYLYTMRIVYEGECISETVGFRRIEVAEGGVLTINGSPIKFKGVIAMIQILRRAYTISREQLLIDGLDETAQYQCFADLALSKCSWAYHFYDRVGLMSLMKRTSKVMVSLNYGELAAEKVTTKA